MRELTEEEKKMMEDDDVGCMDPRAKETLGKFVFVSLLIVSALTLGITIAVIRWL